MEVLSKRVVVLLERDPGTELRAKALRRKREEKGETLEGPPGEIVEGQGREKKRRRPSSSSPRRLLQVQGSANKMEVLSKRVVIVFERDPGTELRAKELRLRKERKEGELEGPPEEGVEGQGTEKKGRRPSSLQIQVSAKIDSCNSASIHYSTPRENNSTVPTSGGGNRGGPAKKKKAVRARLPKRSHSCYFCQKTFLTLSQLGPHLRTHLKERPFPCTLCGKGFARKGHLNFHFRRHWKGAKKPFKCPHPGCSSSFFSKREFRGHAIIHSEKPFFCEYPNCGKSFNRQYHLKRHLRTHSEEKPFACPFPWCGKTFTQTSSLNRHRRKCHPNE